MTHSSLYRTRILPTLGSLCLALPSMVHAQDYLHSEEAIGSVEDVYNGHLTPDLAVSTFRNIDRLFPTRVVPASEKPEALPDAPVNLPEMVSYQVGDASYDLYDFLSLDNVTGMIVLKDGKVVYETYQRGNTPETRWMSMSVAKSITSTLVGAAIVDGHIQGLDDMVTDYVPALAGSAYDGVTIRDILLMASGVEWNETYTDPDSDRRDLLRAQIEQRPGSAMEVMAELPRAHDPGTHHTYSTGETQVLGEVLHGAVGMPLADYLAEKIWQPYGMEADANWWLDSPDGVEIGGSGLSATLRDFARFGQFFLEGGEVDGTTILPEGWTETAGKPQKLKSGETIEYGYMWWPGWTEPSIADGAFAAIGIQGQNIYINPARNVVIATHMAQPKPVGREPVDPLVVFDAISAALD
ncbi:serine hydrolase [Paracoccus sp. 1_MG-2023]|uniref:serine hydrolase domain-containing protein n=1 Tax=unclassified Paracoccus (in: a-proteobacteria) TaxID=2688777 RepID=UPI001C09337C|nr:MULTISPECIES: serine hydrolase [unclassified Paracoccus (in: a-proteobacteria)]MBU2958021.1 beta-lactamase family protein [Paracoccus sp. C2R09]MDO6670344.1 serine hydrolase [Paracoccus sp. 1_MG-2023]